LKLITKPDGTTAKKYEDVAALLEGKSLFPSVARDLGGRIGMFEPVAGIPSEICRHREFRMPDRD